MLIIIAIIALLILPLGKLGIALLAVDIGERIDHPRRRSRHSYTSKSSDKPCIIALVLVGIYIAIATLYICIA